MPLSVLVVDDHASLRDLFRICLTIEEDFEVVGTAADGAAAVRLAAELHPDAIVLDHEMPVQDGLAVLPALRAASPGVRVVVFSASNDDATRHEALARGAAAYLVKDDSGVADVIAALREALHPTPLSA